MEEAENNYIPELKCIKCFGPFHSATGHIFNSEARFCGICAGRFFAFVIYQKHGWHYSSKKKQMVRHEKFKRKFRHGW